MELALGTVQFGLRYGVVGRGSPVPSEEARAILSRAHALGITVLDTATSYGDIEERLSDLIRGLPFAVITKLPPCSPGISPEAAYQWATESLATSYARLGVALRGVLLHRAEDLLETCGDALWAACSKFVSSRTIRLGVSCYTLDSLERVASRYPIAIAQLPGNALDQRIHRLCSGKAGLAFEIHVRSVFLQGLLLTPLEAGARRVPAAAKALANWARWCREQGIPPLRGALSLAKGLRSARYCIVGVDSLAQLEEISAEWRLATPMFAPELASDLPEVIDPRRWTVT